MSLKMFIEKYGSVELNERQSRALKYAFREGIITNRRYAEINEVSNHIKLKERIFLKRK